MVYVTSDYNWFKGATNHTVCAAFKAPIKNTLLCCNCSLKKMHRFLSLTSEKQLHRPIQKNAHNILEKLSVKNQFRFHWVWIWGEKLSLHLLTTNAVGFIFEWRQYELKLNVKYNLTLKHEVAEHVRVKASSSSEWLIAIYKIITYKKISHFQ